MVGTSCVYEGPFRTEHLATTSAASSFLDAYYKIPEADVNRRAELVAIAVPFLPQQMAAELAVKNLSPNPVAFTALFATFGTEAWRLLEPYLGQGPYFKPSYFKTDMEFDGDTEKLLEYLSKHDLLKTIGSYLDPSGQPSGSVTVSENVILNYFHFLITTQDVGELGPIVARGQRHALAKHLFDNKRLSVASHASIAIAAAVAFNDDSDSESYKSLLRDAVKQ